MNQRDLSIKLEELAKNLELLATGEDYFSPESILAMAGELRKLSHENYAPGNGMTWDAVKPKPTKPKGGFISKSGKRMPF